MLPEHRPLMIAHRAGNSLARLHVAEAAGADIVEADVWLYRGRLEVRHEKTVRGLPLLWDRWSLSTGRGPRMGLRELLDALQPATGIMLDLKGRDDGLPAAVLGALGDEPSRRAVLVCSRNWSMLAAFEGIPDVTVVHSAGSERQVRDIEAELRGGTHVRAISVHERFLDEVRLRAMSGYASLVVTWPVNSAARFDELVAWGIGGITTDDVALLSRAAAARRR